MVKTDSIEGPADGALWYHYDIDSDVLYLRLASAREVDTYAEETDDGLLLRSEASDEPVGLTVVNWWKRFGKGALPDSIRALEKAIEPWTQKVAA